MAHYGVKRVVWGGWLPRVKKGGPCHPNGRPVQARVTVTVAPEHTSEIGLG